MLLSPDLRLIPSSTNRGATTRQRDRPKHEEPMHHRRDPSLEDMGASRPNTILASDDMGDGWLQGAKHVEPFACTVQTRKRSLGA